MKGKTVLIVVLVFLVLIALCCCCGGAGAFVARSKYAMDEQVDAMDALLEDVASVEVEAQDTAPPDGEPLDYAFFQGEDSGHSPVERLTVFESNFPRQINPLHPQSSTEGRLASLVYDRLFYVGPRSESWRSRVVTKAVRTHGSDVRVVLVPDVKWSDGEPLTAEDVCFSVLQAPPTRGITGCTVEGELQARVQITGRTDPLKALEVWLLPAHHFAEDGTPLDAAFWSEPVGTGPMKPVRGQTAWLLEGRICPHHRRVIQGLRVLRTGSRFVAEKALLSEEADLSMFPANRAPKGMEVVLDTNGQPAGITRRPGPFLVDAKYFWTDLDEFRFAPVE